MGCIRRKCRYYKLLIMATGKRLLEESMPHNYKQGSVYPTHYDLELEKKYGNRKAKKASHVRKIGQTKVRRQLKNDMMEELNNG